MKTKRLFSILLSLVIVLSAIPFAGTTVFAEALNYDDMTLEEGGTAEGEALYTAYMEQEGRLSNFYAKLRDLEAGESLNVAYFGGSITNGSGASGQDTTSWRALVGQHITNLVQEANPDVTVTNKVLRPSQNDQFDDVSEDGIIINNINGAIGASASYFGVHRVYDDLGFAVKAPDVVFLEFTFNDDGAGDNASRKYTDSNGKEAIAPAVEYEGIIRQIYTYAPDCEIIGIFTTGAKFLNYITQDKYPTLSAERAVLRKYNIPYLYVGRDLMNQIISEDPTAVNITTGNYSKYAAYKKYIGDTVHPTDEGYQFYADIIDNYIDARFAALEAVDTDGTTIIVEDFSNLENVETFEELESYHDISIIKKSPKQIRAYSLYEGENENLLSGFQEYVLPNQAIQTISAHGKALASNYDGASLAFRFTGDSIGLWFGALSNGGMLNAKVYKIDEETNERIADPVATLTDKSLAGSNRPIPIFLSSDLEYGTYEVELWIKKGSSGSASELCRILWNGEGDIEPIEHPDIALSCPEIEVLSSFINCGYNYNISSSIYDKTKENDGFVQNEDGSFRLTYDGTKTSTGENSSFIKFTNMSLASFNASVEHYKYMFVEYFIPADSTYNFNNVSMRVQQTDQMVVQSGSTTHIKNMDFHSGALVKGEWATAIIDISTYMDTCIAEGIIGATHKSNWRRIEFYPFGYSARTTDAMVGATIDIRSIRFSATPEPTVPEVDEESEQIAYVQSSGLITFPDYSEAEAFTNFSDAFDALGEDGGTIIFQGEMTEFKDGTKAHGDVTVRGLEESEHTLNITSQSKQVIKFGNVKFENLDISYEKSDGTGAEVYLEAPGHTLTIGDNVNILPLSSGTADTAYAGPYISSVASANTTNLVFNANDITYTIVTSGRSNIATKFKGHSNYVFNAGTFKAIYATAYNTSKSYSTTFYGDAYYTFNGGTYDGTMVTTGSQRAGSRFGNVIFMVNGGTFNNNRNAISFGSYTAWNADVTSYNPGTHAVIVNCKEVSKTTAGALSATDTKISIGATYDKNYQLTGDTTMAIINNAELADTVKVAIAKPSGTSQIVIADYQIQAMYGKVIPVFEESSTETTSTTAGRLLGFQMIGDTEEHIPYVNGVKLEPKANGLYDLPENFVGTVEFKGPTVAYVYAGEGELTLPDGTTAPTNTTFTTFSDAFNYLADNDENKGGKIYFKGDFSVFKDGTKAHGDVEVIGIGDTAEARAQNKITLNSNSSYNYTHYTIYYGNVTLQNLSLNINRNAISLYAKGYTLTFGENVVMSDDASYNIYAGPFYAKASGTSNFVFNSKDAVYAVASAMFGGSNSTYSYSGNVNSVFNAGTFSNVYDIYNSAAGEFKAFGDVNYTFNGGTFTGIVTPNAYKGGSRVGNVIYTINGGTFARDIFFGQYSIATSATYTSNNPGASVIIANCKEISKTTTGKLSDSTLYIGTPRDDYGGHFGTEIAILNNAELASTTKVAIDSTATATYRIKANYGKVTPVFEASSTSTDSTTAGALKGFEITSDVEGLVPCANGKRLIKKANGYYDLPEGAVTVDFAKFTVEGDANEDNVVDLTDLVRMGKYLNEMDVKINLLNSDINIDALINSDDKNLLRKILLQIAIK